MVSELVASLPAIDLHNSNKALEMMCALEWNTKVKLYDMGVASTIMKIASHASKFKGVIEDAHRVRGLGKRARVEYERAYTDVYKVKLSDPTEPTFELDGLKNSDRRHYTLIHNKLKPNMKILTADEAHAHDYVCLAPFARHQSSPYSETEQLVDNIKRVSLLCSSVTRGALPALANDAPEHLGPQVRRARRARAHTPP